MSANSYRQIVARYNGSVCVSCEHHIAAGEEILYRATDKKIHHNACPISVTAPSNEASTSPQTPPLDGYYTVVMGDGTYRTFRIHTQDDNAQFARGKRVISYLSGSDNENDYQGFAFLNPDNSVFTWKRYADNTQLTALATALVTGDHKAAGVTYAKQSGNCYVCNRKLTTPESIDAGIGPVCATKY